MEASQVSSLLRQTPLFAALPEADLASLAALTVERRFRGGEVVFHEGDPGEALFVVAEGSVKVFVTSEQGDQAILAILGPPDAFGELAILDGGPRSASVVAVGVTRLLSLTRSSLLQRLETSAALSESLLRAMGLLVRRMIAQTADLVFLDLHGRLAKVLVGLFERHGVDAAGARTLDLHVTQRDFAQMVGGSRQTVNEILQTFQARGFLEIRGRSLRLGDLPGLRSRAGLPPQG